MCSVGRRRHPVAVAEHPVPADAVRRLEADELDPALLQRLGGGDPGGPRADTQTMAAAHADSSAIMTQASTFRLRVCGHGSRAVEVKAAGCVVWRRDGGGAPELAVVHRPRYDDWSLPKGKLDPGETFEEAAVREVQEEIGVRGTLGDELPPVGLPRPQGPGEDRPLLAHGAGGRRPSRRTTRSTRCAGWTWRRRPRC